MRKFGMVACCILAGCGGGGSGDSDTTKAPLGAYSGNVIEEGIPYDIAGIFPEGPAGYLFSANGQAVFVTHLDTDGDEIHGDFDTYTSVRGGEYSMIAEKFLTGSLEGKATSTSFSASFTTSINTSGTITLARSSDSTNNDLAAIQGVWSNLDNNVSTALSVSGNQLAGSDSDGCQYQGSIEPNQAGRNAYGLSLRIDCQGSIAQLDGAIARGTLNGNDVLTIIAADYSAALVAIVFRSR